MGALSLKTLTSIAAAKRRDIASCLAAYLGALGALGGMWVAVHFKARAALSMQVLLRLVLNGVERVVAKGPPCSLELACASRAR